jgi:hypothetical protein
VKELDAENQELKATNTELINRITALEAYVGITTS